MVNEKEHGITFLNSTYKTPTSSTYMRSLIFVFLIFSANACPCIDRSTLGRSTWYLLHEIAKQPRNRYFEPFMEALSQIYPCEVCRTHLKENLLRFSVYQDPISMCKFHNEINFQLGKNIFNCSLII